jgi:hypothetical protein
MAVRLSAPRTLLPRNMIFGQKYLKFASMEFRLMTELYPCYGRTHVTSRPIAWHNYTTTNETRNRVGGMEWSGEGMIHASFPEVSARSGRTTPEHCRSPAIQTGLMASLSGIFRWRQKLHQKCLAPESPGKPKKVFCRQFFINSLLAIRITLDSVILYDVKRLIQK